MRSVYFSLLAAAITSAAVGQTGMPHVGLGAGPFVFDTAEQHKVRAVVVARGIPHPWGMAFLPGGNILVTERRGNLRIVRDGVLDPQPLGGLPKVYAVNNAGLFDIALHPKFSENRLVYFTYSKPGPDGQNAITLARGRLEKDGLTEVKDLFTGEWTKILGGSRIAFDPKGLIFMTTGAATAPLIEKAQDPMSVYGKVLRLRDDGTVPPDNPFVGKAGYRPEIYSLGHRDQLGLAIQPETGVVLSNENGPNGGDEVNLIMPGRNYGWPRVSFGRNYNGAPISGSPLAEGVEPPLVVWLPSIAPSGMAFYTGDRFPGWKGNLFVGGMRRGEIAGTGRLERVVFNDKMEELRRESLLTELQHRIRDVRQGPDGLLYVLTEEEDGALIRLEPVQ